MRVLDPAKHQSTRFDHVMTLRRRMLAFSDNGAPVRIVLAGIVFASCSWDALPPVQHCLLERCFGRINELAQPGAVQLGILREHCFLNGVATEATLLGVLKILGCFCMLDFGSGDEKLSYPSSLRSREQELAQLSSYKYLIRALS